MDILDLKYPPVAVRLIRHEALIPEDVEGLDKLMFYYTMVKYAMLGNVFYAREAVQNGKRGAAALGLCKNSEERKAAQQNSKKSNY